MVIDRKSENEILRLTGDYPVVGVIGPRQCGKTTLAKIVMGKLQKPAIYLDLENDDDLAKLAEPVFYLQQYQDQCIVIDEIQRMPKLLPLLRSLVDQQRIPGRFILLGSASPVLIRESSESLAGRIAYLELTPLRLDEIPDHYSWKELWSRGGFPLSFLSENDRKSYEWRQFFLQTYVDRGISVSGLDADPMVIKRLLKMVAALNGYLWNTDNLSRSLGIHAQTVNRYINYLENTFLVSRLRPFNTNIPKRLVKSPKIFIRDSGILHYQNNLSSFDDILNNPIAGSSWEGFVINQIQSALGNHAETYFYRTHQGAESDLLIVIGNDIKACIEIKLTSSPKITKGFFISIEDLKSENNFVIIPGNENYRISEKISVNGLNYFLTFTLPGILSIV